MHTPVLTEEVLKILDPKPNQVFVDGTIDGGGHSLKILELTGPQGKILGIDWDRSLLELLKLKVEFSQKERLILVQDNFAHLKKIVVEHSLEKIEGILFDFGVSSYHLEKCQGGFSFLRDEELDMRFDRQSVRPTARQLLNHWPENDLAKILKEYGQERYARNIAREIVRARQLGEIKKTFQLVKIIALAVPAGYCHRRIHFATKTFQALRMAVNDELANIQQGLSAAIEILPRGGKVAAISFHSLEDRIVKNIFREGQKNRILKILTKKPIQPSRAEVSQNPRARSAKLRVAEKI